MRTDAVDCTFESLGLPCGEFGNELLIQDTRKSAISASGWLGQAIKLACVAFLPWTGSRIGTEG